MQLFRGGEHGTAGTTSSTRKLCVHLELFLAELTEQKAGVARTASSARSCAGDWFRSGVGQPGPYFRRLPFLAAARSCRAMAATLSMSSQGAGFPVQISNWRAAW